MVAQVNLELRLSGLEVATEHGLPAGVVGPWLDLRDAPRSEQPARARTISERAIGSDDMSRPDYAFHDMAASRPRQERRRLP